MLLGLSIHTHTNRQNIAQLWGCGVCGGVLADDACPLHHRYRWCPHRRAMYGWVALVKTVPTIYIDEPLQVIHSFFHLRVAAS